MNVKVIVGTVLALSVPQLVPHAGAAKAPVVISDQADDANGTGQATPVGSQSAFDIKSVTFASLPKCTGFTVTLELAGTAASNNFAYRTNGVTAGNDYNFNIRYLGDSAGTVRSEIYYSTKEEPGFNSVELSTPAKADGSKIVLTVLEKDAKAARETLSKLKVSAAGATTGARVGIQGTATQSANGVPDGGGGGRGAYDTVESDQTFTVC